MRVMKNFNLVDLIGTNQCEESMEKRLLAFSLKLTSFQLGMGGSGQNPTRAIFLRTRVTRSKFFLRNIANLWRDPAKID